MFRRRSVGHLHRRDRAFYVAQLCFAVDGSSEVHLVKSVDGGRTWTPAGFEATAASNVDPSTGEIDTSLFLDKEAVAVDNSRSSPHYGRIYVTYAKFHMLPSGFSDYCPIQVAYTDRIPTNHPFNAEFSHTAVVPDDPGDDGRGGSANRDKYRSGEGRHAGRQLRARGLQSTKNRHVLLQKSSDGGESFLRSRFGSIDPASSGTIRTCGTSSLRLASACRCLRRSP